MTAHSKPIVTPTPLFSRQFNHRYLKIATDAYLLTEKDVQLPALKWRFSLLF
jgi:hypothetical protein